MSLAAALVSYAAFAVMAIVGALTGRRPLLVVGKPIATAGLFSIVAMADAPWPVIAAIALCVVGDAALLFEGTLAFAIGLGTFLIAHLAYAAAFVRGAGEVGAASIGAAALAVAFTAVLLTRILPRISRGLRAPVVVYGLAIATMTSAAWLTLGGPWPRQAQLAIAGGAAFFLASDGLLAWNRFVRPVRHGQAATLALYWLGQLGIALGIRWAT